MLPGLTKIAGHKGSGAQDRSTMTTAALSTTTAKSNYTTPQWGVNFDPSRHHFDDHACPIVLANHLNWR